MQAQEVFKSIQMWDWGYDVYPTDLPPPSNFRIDQAVRNVQEYLVVDPRSIVEIMTYFYSGEFIMLVALICAYKLARVVIEKKL